MKFYNSVLLNNKIFKWIIVHGQVKFKSKLLWPNEIGHGQKNSTMAKQNWPRPKKNYSGQVKLATAKRNWPASPQDPNI